MPGAKGVPHPLDGGAGIADLAFLPGLDGDSGIAGEEFYVVGPLKADKVFFTFPRQLDFFVVSGGKVEGKQ
jgi:hypothetical protein